MLAAASNLMSGLGSDVGSKLAAVCANDGNPTPIVLYHELAMATHGNDNSGWSSKRIADKLAERLGGTRELEVKVKALLAMRSVAASGSLEFRRCLQEHRDLIKAHTTFHGPPDELRGMEPYARIHKAARETIEAMYDASPRTAGQLVHHIPGTSIGSPSGGAAGGKYGAISGGANGAPQGDAQQQQQAYLQGQQQSSFPPAPPQSLGQQQQGSGGGVRPGSTRRGPSMQNVSSDVYVAMDDGEDGAGGGPGEGGDVSGYEHRSRLSENASLKDKISATLSDFLSVPAAGNEAAPQPSPSVATLLSSVTSLVAPGPAAPAPPTGAYGSQSSSGGGGGGVVSSMFSSFAAFVSTVPQPSSSGGGSSGAAASSAAGRGAAVGYPAVPQHQSVRLPGPPQQQYPPGVYQQPPQSYYSSAQHQRSGGSEGGGAFSSGAGAYAAPHSSPRPQYPGSDGRQTSQGGAYYLPQQQQQQAGGPPQPLYYYYPSGAGPAAGGSPVQVYSAQSFMGMGQQPQQQPLQQPQQQIQPLQQGGPPAAAAPASGLPVALAAPGGLQATAAGAGGEELLSFAPPLAMAAGGGGPPSGTPPQSWAPSALPWMQQQGQGMQQQGALPWMQQGQGMLPPRQPPTQFGVLQQGQGQPPNMAVL